MSKKNVILSIVVSISFLIVGCDVEPTPSIPTLPEKFTVEQLGLYLNGFSTSEVSEQIATIAKMPACDSTKKLIVLTEYIPGRWTDDWAAQAEVTKRFAALPTSAQDVDAFLSAVDVVMRNRVIVTIANASTRVDYAKVLVLKKYVVAAHGHAPEARRAIYDLLKRPTA